MSQAAANPKVDKVLARFGKWRDAFDELRQVMLDCPLAEEVKWGWPCYVHEGKNVAVLHAFKDYVAILFMNGALMQDPQGVLVQQTENVQSARQIRFTSIEEVLRLKPALKAYVEDAVGLARSGAKVARKPTAEYAVPDELRDRMDEDPDLRAAFEALTPGRQRGYLLHFASAKQPRTRQSRIDACLPKILQGKGLLD